MHSRFQHTSQAEKPRSLAELPLPCEHSLERVYFSLFPKRPILSAPAGPQAAPRRSRTPGVSAGIKGFVVRNSQRLSGVLFPPPFSCPRFIWSQISRAALSELSCSPSPPAGAKGRTRRGPSGWGGKVRDLRMGEGRASNFPASDRQTGPLIPSRAASGPQRQGLSPPTRQSRFSEAQPIHF